MASPLTWLRISVLLFVVSLALPALLDPLGFGAEMFALGWLGPMAGQAGWYGNPFLFASWLLVGRSIRAPQALGSGLARAGRIAPPTLGLAVALTSLVTLPGTSLQTPFTIGNVRLLGPGLILWLASFVAAIVAAVTSTHAPARTT